MNQMIVLQILESLL